MDPLVREAKAPQNYKFVNIAPKAAYSIQQVASEDWRNFFEFIRLNLRSRITSLDGQDLIKLQGKLEAADEIEKLFLDIAKMPTR